NAQERIAAPDPILLQREGLFLADLGPVHHEGGPCTWGDPDHRALIVAGPLQLEVGIEPFDLAALDASRLRDGLERGSWVDHDLLVRQRRLQLDVSEAVLLRLLRDPGGRDHERNVVPRLAGEALPN